MSCSREDPAAEATVSGIDRNPEIYPEYAGVTIPPNIAPLHFSLEEGEGSYRIVIQDMEGDRMVLKERKGVFFLNEKKWAALLDRNRDGALQVIVYRKEKADWASYQPFQIYVAQDPIDPYLVYRLIPPGYETWSSMGLYQRDLTSFREVPLIENRNAEENCVNCHSFNMGNPEEMLFHIRGSMGGTMIRKGNIIRKVDLKREETLSAGVYPSWHPSGDYIAFSTNRIEQYFHAAPEHSIEVLDRQSDLIVYDTESGEVTGVPGTGDDLHMETYPCWSPDGRWLYFSRSDADAETPFDSIRYDLYRLSFDPSGGRFGKTPELVFSATSLGLSASFPRISPDGKYLLCTVHDYGTFPIWHPEADLCLIDLSDGSWTIPEGINSDDTESFHSWSANSRWVVVSSRRDDGRYTRPYLCYLDRNGTFQKPFLLPQRDPEAYQTTIYAYNRPELISGNIGISPRKWIRMARQHTQEQTNQKTVP
ncbi:MAG: TolB family protein [Bacteroidales bacterium]